MNKPAGALVQAERDSLTQLVARGRGIASLAGIDSLKGLQVLDLADNRIQDLSPLAALTQLTYLDLEHNRVEDTQPLACLTQLQTLVLSHNAVTDITPLAGLGRLRTLGLLGDPLDQAARTTHIPALRARGVQVSYGISGVEPMLSEGSVVFYSDRGGDRDLYAMDVGSGYIVQLTQDPAWDWPTPWTRAGAMSCA